MITIWKFPLTLTDAQTIMVPADYESLSVGIQDDRICLWARVDSDAPKMPMTVFIVGTGHPIQPDGLHFVGTIQMPPYVWHIFTN